MTIMFLYATFWGWFVGWLGLLIGFCASKGYELLDGKSGLPKAVIVVLATIFGVIVGQVMGDFISIGKMIAQEELEGAAYMDIPSIYFLVIMNELEFLREVLKNFMIGLVFATLGVWDIIKSIITNSKSGEPVEG